MYERTRVVSNTHTGKDEVYPTLNEALRGAMKDPQADVWLHDEKCQSSTRKYSNDCPCGPIRIQKGTRK